MYILVAMGIPARFRRADALMGEPRRWLNSKEDMPANLVLALEDMVPLWQARRAICSGVKACRWYTIL
jgi:hypothetical protein